MVMSEEEKKAFVRRMKKGKQDAAKGKSKTKGGGKRRKKSNPLKISKKAMRWAKEDRIKRKLGDLKKAYAVNGKTRWQIAKKKFKGDKIALLQYYYNIPNHLLKVYGAPKKMN